MFELRDRGYTDNNTSETAGKLLPLHPTARYKNFPTLWKQTRKISGYVPRPKTCMTDRNDFFPCCLSCAAVTDPETVKEKLARRSANAGWLSADWWWDFGWTLPEGFVGYGIGATVPTPQPPKNYVFVLDPNLKRKRLEFTLEEHANLHSDFQHEAKAKISSFESVSFPGQIMATPAGQIQIAVSRTVWFGSGLKVSDRYIFEAIEMPFDLPILKHGADIQVASGKVTLNGVELN
ncbi:hypothetical protein QUA41_30625 [Microcoleus sp. Pol11C1]|uniref:hypothetical protein n=1 Tax=unclassified Microcoleus TaxID=2642155 RepID=UPI002FD593CB